LRTAIEHGVVMATGPRITLRDLPASVRQAADGKGRLPIPNTDQPYNLHDTNRRMIERALAETDGNITQAAQKLGISRRTLHRKLKEFRDASPEEEPPEPTPPPEETG